MAPRDSGHQKEHKRFKADAGQEYNDNVLPTPSQKEDYGSFGSAESMKSELSIFDGPSFQVTQLKAQWLCLNPKNQYQGTAGMPIQFTIPHSPGWYLDFNDTFIVFKVAIKNATGAAVDAKEVVAFENFAIGTLFKDVSFTTSNQTKLEGENQTYAYRAYFHCLFNGSYTAKKFQLQVSGWDQDTAGQYDAVDATADKAGSNLGFNSRRLWTAGNKPLQCAGQVFLDTWLQKQYFIDGQDFHVTFKLNDPAFCLHAMNENVKYKIDMLEMQMFVRQVNVSPSVLMGHAQGLQKHNLIIPYNGHKIFTKLIKKGGLAEHVDDFFQGVYPKAVMIGFVDHEAFVGKFSKNPFNFQHWNITEIGLTYNGNPLPSVPFKPDFTNQNFAREYYSLFLQLGKTGIFSDDNAIKLVDFRGGCALFTFNLSPDLSLSGHAQPARLANLGVDIRFGVEVPVNLQMIGLAIYDTTVEMTRDRLWILDPSQAAN